MWAVALDGGPRRVNHAAARIGEHIYSFGGYSTTDELNDWDPIQVHILDTRTFRWKKGPDHTLKNAPYHRYGHSVVAYDDRIYLWGGRNNSDAFDAISCFDVEKMTWSTVNAKGHVPFAKDGHSACVINNKMYIFGGFEYLTNQYSQEIHSFDFKTKEWNFIRARGTIPSPRDFHTAIAVGHHMYVFGGRSMDVINDLEVYCQTLFRFDTVTEMWESVLTSGNVPEGRRSHSAWLYNDFMYIFGGYNSVRRKHYNTIYRISLNTSVWELVETSGNEPCQRRRQCCIIHNDKMFLFGGTSPHPGQLEESDKAVDNSDLYVLDLNVSLQTLCMLEVIKHNLDITYLPVNIRWDVTFMTTKNNISEPLKVIYTDDDTSEDY